MTPWKLFTKSITNEIICREMGVSCITLKLTVYDFETSLPSFPAYLPIASESETEQRLTATLTLIQQPPHDHANSAYRHDPLLQTLVNSPSRIPNAITKAEPATHFSSPKDSLQVPRLHKSTPPVPAYNIPIPTYLPTYLPTNPLSPPPPRPRPPAQERPTNQPTTHHPPSLPPIRTPTPTSSKRNGQHSRRGASRPPAQTDAIRQGHTRYKLRADRQQCDGMGGHAHDLG